MEISAPKPILFSKRISPAKIIALILVGWLIVKTINEI